MNGLSTSTFSDASSLIRNITLAIVVTGIIYLLVKNQK